ncbi:MAG: hypothetical protein JW917_04860 [Ignavibacteria bacterium]|nr:hypothetical protein [Ignavibacteria bacterium]
MKKITAVLFLLFIALYSFLPAQTCDESMTFEIDNIKQEIETMLVNATTMDVALETGENLIVFYVDGQMIKISVEMQEPYISAELFFRDGFVRHISEDVREGNEFYRNYYYFNEDKLICYRNEKSGDYNDSGLYAVAEQKWLERIERYLLAIQ